MTKFNTSSFPKLSGAKLVLRQVVPSDATAIFQLRSNPIVNKYIDRKSCTGIEEASAFIDSVTKNYQEGKALYWGISLRNTAKIIGCVAVYNFSESDQKCEIGYELIPEFQGKGIMLEALETVVDFVFQTLTLCKIEAFVHSQNKASIKLLTKLGFTPIDNKSIERSELAFERISSLE